MIAEFTYQKFHNEVSYDDIFFEDWYNIISSKKYKLELVIESQEFEVSRYTLTGFKSYIIHRYNKLTFYLSDILAKIVCKIKRTKNDPILTQIFIAEKIQIKNFGGSTEQFIEFITKEYRDNRKQ
jgi:hypothetical protein